MDGHGRTGMAGGGVDAGWCWLERQGLDLRLMPGDRVCGAVGQTGLSPTYARLDGTWTCAVICVVCVLRLRALCRGGRQWGIRR